MDSNDFVLLARLVAVLALAFVAYKNLRTFEIPDGVSIGGIVSGLGLSFALPELHAGDWIASEFSARSVLSPGLAELVSGLAGGLFGLAATAMLRCIGNRLFGTELFGVGDMKLVMAVGTWSGVRGCLWFLAAGLVFSALVGIARLVSSRGRFSCAPGLAAAPSAGVVVSPSAG